MGVFGCESQAYLKPTARVARRSRRPRGPCPISSEVKLVLITRVRAKKVSRKDTAISHTEIVDGSRWGPALVNGMSRPAAANGRRGRAYEARRARL